MAFDYVNFNGLSHFYDKLKTKFSNVLMYSKKKLVMPSVSKYWGKIAYGNGRLVAITENNSSTNIAAYSDDLGVTWHLITLPVSAPWYTVGFGNGRFVILPYNNSNKALYSDDGINWNSTTLPNTKYTESVCYGNGFFVATARYSDMIMYSQDGITWTSQTINGSGLLKGIDFGYDNNNNPRFVTVGDSTNKAVYGTGTQWNISTLPKSTMWSDVAYGNGRFVATSSRAYTAYSDDGGASWKSGGSIPYENYDYNFSEIAYGNNTFVALNMGISTSKVAYSKDYGINWTTIELPIYYDSIVWNDISFIDDRFIVITRNGEMLISFDGVNWSNEVPPMLFDMEGNNITNEIKSLVSSPSNNNILINSNFANPVNTKGQSSYEINNYGGYTIDGWKCAGTTLTFENNKYITLTPNQLIPDGSQDLPSTLTFIQDISNPSMYSNRVLTASVKYRIRNYENTEGLVLKIICDGNTQLQDLIADGEWHTSFVSYITENITSQLRTAIGSNSRYETSCIDVEWIKLEEGSIATPYVAKHYAEELQLCRYDSDFVSIKKVTKDEYDNLPESKNSDNILYAISDGDELSAKNLEYDGSVTGLGNNVQDAVDKLNSNFDEQSKKKSSYQALHNPNDTSVSSIEKIVTTYNNRKFSDYYLITFVLQVKGWIRNSVTVPISQFKKINGVSVYYTDSEDVTRFIDVSYVSETSYKVRSSDNFDDIVPYFSVLGHTLEL